MLNGKSQLLRSIKKSEGSQFVQSEEKQRHQRFIHISNRYKPLNNITKLAEIILIFNILLITLLNY